jgi:hypothetical protein
MELILMSGIGTFVLLAAQLLDYLRETPHWPVVCRGMPLTAEELPHGSATLTTDVETQYDRAA